jgi:hypothetical protein
VTKAWSEG